MSKYKSSHQRGITLLETTLGVALFAFIAVSMFATLARVFQVSRDSQAVIDGIALANAQFEIIRNLSYSQIGTIAGIPSGTLIPVQILESGGKKFIATTTVRNIDLPFDGVAGGIPNDLSPADNKLVEIELMCISCKNFRPLILSTKVGPRDLEGNSSNGSLFIKVLDASGLPLAGANVQVLNNAVSPSVNINDVTNSAGLLQIIDAPPSIDSYEILVSKSGYSTEQTYATSGPPTNPLKPHATVAIQTVTQVTFTIDRVAVLNFSSVSPSCAVIPNINFQITGSKLVATTPNVFKYDNYFVTDGSGVRQLTDIEWDSYALMASSSGYDLAGIVPLAPISIAPGATQNIQLVMVPKSSPSVMVTVKDGVTGLPVTGATVILGLSGASTTQMTGRGYLSQTDWSGGGGQSDFVDTTRYASGNGVDEASVPGTLRLRNILGFFVSNSEIESSTFDTGAPANFYQFTYQPTGQPTDPAGDSRARFHVATGNSTSSWNFLGPDGTASTFYNATTTNFHPINNGNRYLRYRVFLSTASTTLTPTVSDIQFTFTSACVPPGQVIFQGLANGTYNVEVIAGGYTSYDGSIVVSASTPWQEHTVTLTP